MTTQSARASFTGDFKPIAAITARQLAAIAAARPPDGPADTGPYAPILKALRAGRMTAVTMLSEAPSRSAGGETWAQLIADSSQDAWQIAEENKPALLSKALFIAPNTPLPWTLPQIALKSGIETLLCSSPEPVRPANTAPTGSAAPFPSEAFWWQGIDGSRVLVCRLPASIPVTLVSSREDLDRLLVSITQMQSSNNARSIQEFIEEARADAFLPVWAAELSYGREGTTGEAADESARRDALFARAATRFGIPNAADSDTLDTALAAQIDTRGMRRPVLMISNLSHYANEAVTVPISERENPAAAVGPEGDTVLVQVLKENGRRLALFVPKNLPLHGYSVWDMATTLTPPSDADTVSVSETHLENDSLLAEFDADTGLLTRLYDKDGDRELMEPAYTLTGPKKTPKLIRGKCGNRLELSLTTVTELADRERETQQSNVDLSGWEQVEAAEVVETGPVRGAIRFQRRFNDTEVTQTVRLTAGSARLDFAMEIYARPERDEGSSDQGKADLQVVFPVAINGLQGAYSAPYGVVRRPGHINSPWDASLFQNSSGNWVDISEGDYGVALMHTGGATVAALDNSLCIGISVGAFSASEEQSSGAGTTASDLEAAAAGSRRLSTQRLLTFALFPHPGDYREGEVIEQAEAMYLPPKARTLTGNQPGALPMERSFFSVDNAAVTLEVTEVEANAVFVRLIEWHNTRGEVILTTALPVRKAFLTDLRREVLQEISVGGNEIVCAIRPFEILTLKLTL